MYCSTHSTPPLISKPSFLGCIGVSNIRGPMGLKKWLGGSAPCWSSCPTSQHPSDWTGCRKGRPGSWWLFPLRWCPHKKVMFGDRVWRDRNVLYISHRLVMSFWISESRVIHGMAHDFLLLQSVPLYAKDHPRPWMRWMFERKKCRDIETSKQDNPWCCCFLVAGGGKRSHGTGACMPTLASNRASRFPEAESASLSQSLWWTK